MFWAPMNGRTAKLHLILRLRGAHAVNRGAPSLIEGSVNAIWHYTLGGI